MDFFSVSAIVPYRKCGRIANIHAPFMQVSLSVTALSETFNKKVPDIVRPLMLEQTLETDHSFNLHRRHPSL
jgi:hypothetical protein